MSSEAQGPQPTAHEKGGCSRRGFLRRSGTAVGTVATIGAGTQAVPQYSPVGQAQAVAPAVAVAGVGAAAVTSWAVKEYDVMESDAPPEGTSADTLNLNVYDTLDDREGDNASTFIDNDNMLDGLSHSAYSDAKIAAIEALNEQLPQEDVEDAAVTTVDDYLTTVAKNLLKGWNESVKELWANADRVLDHPELEMDDVFAVEGDDDAEWRGDFERKERDVTLPDGSTFTLKRVAFDPERTDGGDDGTMYTEYDPVGYDDDPSYPRTNHLAVQYDELSTRILQFSGWNDIWSTIDETHTNVTDGLIMWVDGTYEDVQAGEIDTADLLTPREWAEMSAEEEGVNRALADLMALNIPVDLEREADILFSRDNDQLELSGKLAYTEGDTLNTGETYHPDDLAGDVYLTYDVSQGSGSWSAYETGVDGGLVTFTAEPFAEGTVYVIHTVTGETAEVQADDFDHDEDEDEWTTDVSDQLDDAITDIEEVDMFHESGETRYETIRIDSEFTIQSFSDSDGNEYDSADFTNSEPQTDDNYRTEEEWEELQKEHEALIEEYEEALEEEDDGVELGLPSFSFGPDEGSIVGLGIIAAVIALAIGAITN